MGKHCQNYCLSELLWKVPFWVTVLCLLLNLIQLLNFKSCIIHTFGRFSVHLCICWPFSGYNNLTCGTADLICLWCSYFYKKSADEIHKTFCDKLIWYCIRCVTMGEGQVLRPQWVHGIPFYGVDVAWGYCTSNTPFLPGLSQCSIILCYELSTFQTINQWRWWFLQTIFCQYWFFFVHSVY